MSTAGQPKSLVSPKQPPAHRGRDWYPYYAGFTEEFAESVLAEHLSEATLVLDPWSGSGTTTAVCARLGVPSIGVDVNPALSVIARARLTPRSMTNDWLSMGRQILNVARELHVRPDDKDPLRRWMRRDATSGVRAIQRAIHTLVAKEVACPDHGNVAAFVDQLPELACFFYCALFATVRDLLSRFRTSNPTWHKSPASHRQKIATPWNRLAHDYVERIKYLQDRLKLSQESYEASSPKFYTRNAMSLPFPEGSFDGVLTSPPYATRIDYVVGSLPELSILGLDDGLVSSLRSATTGSPVVTTDDSLLYSDKILSAYAIGVLREIGSHPSKGSRPYYFPWMRGYLLGLQAGLKEIVRTVVPGKAVCIVLQDSYYKALHIDLQRIVAEILGALGKSLDDRYDYPVTTLRSQMNPRAREHLSTRNNSESLLVFG